MQGNLIFSIFIIIPVFSDYTLFYGDTYAFQTLTFY